MDNSLADQLASVIGVLTQVAAQDAEVRAEAAKQAAVEALRPRLIGGDLALFPR